MTGARGGTTPPPLAMRLLKAAVPASEREVFEGDLIEAYDRMLADRGPLRARLWFWRQTLSALITLRTPAPSANDSLPTGDSMLLTFLSDLRHGARLLRRAPAFTAVCILTLALAIGASTTIFSVVNPILLRALPYPQPDRLITVWERNADGSRSNLGFATFADLAREARTLKGTAAMGSWEPTLSSPDAAERLSGQRVSASYFRVLGVHPVLGRDFLAEEDVKGNRFVILGHGLWQRHFGGDSALVGRTILLNDNAYTVVGIMPASFDNVLSPNAQLWTLLGYDASLNWACRTCRHLRMVARVRDDVSIVAAAEELNRLSDGLVATYPTDYPAPGTLVIPLQETVTSSARPILIGISGAVALILLLAVANVSSLQLARAARREDEFAIRAALGADRRRVMQQLLAEGILLSVLGGLAGVLAAYLSLPVMLANLPAALPRIGAVRIDGTALAVASAITLLFGITTGLTPVWQAGRSELVQGLRSGVRLTGPRRHAARSTLVVVEVAVALMLLVGAGLLGQSLVRLLSVDPGFDPSRLLTIEVQASGARYREDAAVYANHDRIREAVRAVPGVTGVGLASQLALAGNLDQYGVHAEDRPLANPELAPSADRYVMSPDFTTTMRIALLRGRSFDDADSRDSARKVVIVSAALATKIWQSENPIGKRVQMGGPESPWREVVGVAANVRHSGLDAEETQQVYVPERQWPWSDNTVMLVVRTRGDAASLASAVRAALRGVDPGLAIGHVATMDQLVAMSSAQRRLALALFGGFAVVAMLLAGAGIYGVLANSVIERTREIGVRTALGATPAAIAKIIVTHGAKLTIPGLALGLLGALALGRYLQSLLFAVRPTDPLTLLAVATLLAVVAAIACLLPALRAVRVDPMNALRSD